jgi:hypothetical protein
MLRRIELGLVGRSAVALGACGALFLWSVRGEAQETMDPTEIGDTAIGAPPIAPTDPPDPSIRRHDGFYLRIAIGPAIAIGTHDQNEAGEGNVMGGGVATDVALGGTIASGLVLGGGLWGMGTFSTRYDNGEKLDAKGMSLGMLGPFIDYYFNERSGGHLMFAIGLAGVMQPKGEDIPDGLNFAGGGLGALLGGGYEWWIGAQWSMGIVARVQYLRVATETEAKPKIEGTMSLLSPALQLGFTYH